MKVVTSSLQTSKIGAFSLVGGVVIGRSNDDSMLVNFIALKIDREGTYEGD